MHYRAATLLFILSTFEPAAAQRPQRALSLQDYFRIETAETPAISPDGRSVVFVRSYFLEGEDRRQSELWLAPADGSAAARRIAAEGRDPRWTPDGKMLAFTASGGVWFLTMDPPGPTPFQIPSIASMPVFSPDNNNLAFVRVVSTPGKPQPKYESDFERQMHERFKGRIIDWMNYRFDGRGYLPDPASKPAQELFLMPREGASPKQLTSLGVTVTGPQWSPDSKSLVFTADTHQRDEHQYDRADVFTVSVDGKLVRLTDDGYNHSNPVWSRDGKWIYFQRTQSLNQIIAAKQAHGSPVDVYRIPAAGGQMENLTGAWDLLPGTPIPGADNATVYFTGGTGGNVHLFRATGGKVEQVTKGERVAQSFSLSSSAQQMAYVATDPTHPQEVFSARVDGTGEKKLSALHDSFLAGVRFHPAKQLLYKSKDGTPVEGWTIAPPGAKALILNMHGGPHGAYTNSFSFAFQLQAANGYAVLYTNPRGSTNYGEKFLYGTWGEWGGKDFEDVMAGVDAAIQRHGIDEQRLGVTGYSYGGFLTNWVITHSKRFAAAVCGAGVSNWISDYGTADIPRTKETEFFGPPWDAKAGEILLRQSPVVYAGNVITPTLFLHGEADLRVPIEQAEQMYTALQKRRVPTRFIRYPGAYHGNWRPWSMAHRLHQEMEWWKEYLAPKVN